MLRTLTIQGFKSIANLELELGRVNCLIGANGVGKSNVLEALGILGAAASGVVDDESLLRRGVRAGTPRLYKTSFAGLRTPPHISMGITASPHAAYRISLLNPLDAPEPAWAYKTETLNDGERDIVSAGVRSQAKSLNPKAGLAALKRVELAEDNPAAQLMQTLQDYAIYCPNTPALRGIAPDPQTRAPVGLNGGRLAEGFADLQRALHADNQAGEAMLDDILTLIDWVDEVEVSQHANALLSNQVPRGKWMLKFTDRFMNANRNTLTAYDASEGALYILFCATLCLAEYGPKVFAIDNLDQALNPRLLTRLVSHLAAWLAYRDPDRQLLFTAHNPAVLDGLDLNDPEVRLFAVDRTQQGHTSVRRIVLSEPLHQLLHDYPLSRLWMMGHLGAVPNV